MVYEKKMLILTGYGKGIVLIEKSGLGVKFALRAFDVPARGGLKAGVITKSAVFVRDLPDSDNPSAVFYIDGIEIDKLHFAVFDTRLLLYGAFGTRMWEANVMDLLTRHDKRPILPEKELPTLPPIAARPAVLPLADGSGIVQKSDRLYGDEALAESNFYTPFDLSERMPKIDKFLDSPRILDGAYYRAAQSQAAAEVRTAVNAETTAILAEHQAESPINSEYEDGIDSVLQSESSEAPLHEAEGDTFEQSFSDIAEDLSASEAAAEYAAAAEADRTVDMSTEQTDAPWARTARWLKSRSKRMIGIKSESVSPITAKAEIKRIRETEFFERVGKDVEKLFASAPKDDELAELLPDLEWVKVAFDGSYVSVGRNGDMFLCYAVAGLYEKISPLGDKAQWLPRLRNVPTGKGYWLIFQDLATGDILGGC